MSGTNSADMDNIELETKELCAVACIRGSRDVKTLRWRPPGARSNFGTVWGLSFRGGPSVWKSKLSGAYYSLPHKGSIFTHWIQPDVGDCARRMVATGEQAGVPPAPAVLVRDLSYKTMFGTPILSGINMDLPPGSRCLLCGANGAGKTTLLSVLAGKFMVPESAVRLLGRPAFHDLTLVSSGDVSYLGTQWRRSWSSWAGSSTPLMGNLKAETLLANIPGADPARKERLIKLLGIDLNWEMLSCSDGQRRRVQIAMGLMRPYQVRRGQGVGNLRRVSTDTVWAAPACNILALYPSQVLLLDEITVDMDVLGRLDLLQFFQEVWLGHDCGWAGSLGVSISRLYSS